MSVQQGAWSRAVNLESLGLHHAFYVLGLPQAVGRASKLTGSAEDSIMHFDCERVIAPRGFSPRKNRRATHVSITYQMLHLTCQASKDGRHISGWAENLTPP